MSEPIDEQRGSATDDGHGPDPIAQLLSEIWVQPVVQRTKQVAAIFDEGHDGGSTAMGAAADPDPSVAQDPNPEPAEAVAVAAEVRADSEPALDGDDDVDPLAAVLASAHEDRPRSGRRRLLVIALALIVIAAILVWFGVRTILSSSDGRLVTRIADPSAPGFEAVVEKTPTDLILAVGDDGSLASATILALSSDTKGGVLTVPVETDVYVATSTGLVAPVALGDYVVQSGTDAGSMKLGELLNLSFTHVDVIRPTDLSTRFGTDPLTVNNPSEVIGADGAVVFPKGSISLGADQLWTYLASSSPKESPAARAGRSEAFWRALLSTGDASATPSSDGIDRYLTSLAAADVTYTVLPTSEIAAAGGAPARLRLAEGVTGPSAIAAIVPLPEGAPGRRPRLRVLDGTGQLDDARGAAVLLAAGGGQVDVIGNDRNLEVAVTQIVYSEPAQQAAAERMKAVLGVGDVVQSTQTNSALDITITLGADYLRRPSSATSGVTGG